MTIVESEPSEREQIITALKGHALTASRLPIHYVDQRARIHEQINNLLTLLELT